MGDHYVDILRVTPSEIAESTNYVNIKSICVFSCKINGKFLDKNTTSRC